MDVSDFATIYDLNPLYSAGITGAGAQIAVIEPCWGNMDLADTFWSFEAPSQKSAAYRNYGTPAACYSIEADLDYEWAGAVAPQAQIWMVSSNASNPNWGAVQGVVEDKLAPVVTMSYSDCESSSDQAWIDLWQQAAAEGITGIDSSGDAGAAGCDSNTATVATHGQAINGMCASPYVTCVGGTQFNDVADPGEYWSATGQALGYIPEVAWAESGEGSPPTIFGASGGGFSTLVSRPSWQTGNSGSKRGVPDVALSAASHDGYRICSVALLCAPGWITYAFGTSAGAPSFAGIVALLVQATGQWQGSVNPGLYGLAGNNNLSVFHDVVSGNNSVNGVQGFAAGPGWDPVTGLGSVDAAALVNHWPTTAPAPPLLSGIEVSKVPPPATGCTTPPPASAFLTTDTMVYLTFNAHETSSDQLTTDWLAPDGSVEPGHTWPPETGFFCFPGAQLKVAGLAAGKLGVWRARIYDNGTQIGSVVFTVSGPPSVVLLNAVTTTSAPSTCVTPPEVSSFTTASPQVSLYVQVSGAQVGDIAQMNFIRPDGVLYQAHYFKPGSSGTVCFPSNMPLAGSAAASYPGTWTAQVFWNQPSTPLATLNFTINASTAATGTTYYFPQLALGGGYQSTLTYVNYSPQNVSCTTSFYADTSVPLQVPFSGGAVSMRTDSLAPGASIHVETQASGLISEGWAEAQCTAPVKASMLYRLYHNGVAQGEASVNASANAASQFASFAQTATGLAFANPGMAASTISIAALDAAGAELASGMITLYPNAHTALNVGSFLGIGAFTGSTQIVSTAPVVSLALNAEAFPVFSSLPPADESNGIAATSTTWYIPHLAFGGGYQTTLTYVNYSSSPVACQTNFYADSGALLSVPFSTGSVSARNDELPANGSMHVQTSATQSATSTGWAQVTCRAPVKASVLYRLYSSGGAPQGEASVNASNTPASEFVSFAQQATGVAFANPSTSAASITVTALDSSGSVLGSKSVALAANAHAAYNIGPLLGLTSFSGSVQITSTVPIVCLTLNAEAYPVFSSLPPGDLAAGTPLSSGN